MTLDKFVEFTCEDEFRWDKLPKETRIPAGTYQLQLKPDRQWQANISDDMGIGMGMIGCKTCLIYLRLHSYRQYRRPYRRLHSLDTVQLPPWRSDDDLPIASGISQLAVRFVPAIEAGTQCTISIIDKDRIHD